MKRLLSTRPARGIGCLLAFLATALSARAQFTLDLHPVAPGTMALGFTLEAGFYYAVDSSADLRAGFVQASGWMLGDGSTVSWPIYYPVGPAASGGAR